APLSTESPTSVTSPLSLHDALPICSSECRPHTEIHQARVAASTLLAICTRSVSRSRERNWSARRCQRRGGPPVTAVTPAPGRPRSEEHTSELQSRFDLVCRLLLEKK